MGVRVGVDVGGTFTKAIAFDLAQTKVVAEAAVPTTHGDEHGVAQGVVQVVASIADDVGAPNIELVVHSTTQAVNALLEGDTEPVGVIGLGRRPELNRTRKRTELRNIELAPGKLLCTMPRFFDVTNGLDEEAIEKALVELKELGAGTVCVAEAFAPDDTANEERVAALAAKAGLPACMSTELSGLYGLELRAVTAAINASVLTIAAATAAYVEEGLASAGVHAPLLVMRGDGGATDMNGFRLHPARTLYSGPAATVAGALRFTEATEAVVVEIGGTSTNVAAIHDGQPALSYVRVASHATALRSIDVRVIGAAGGSMLRVRRGKVYGVGPRSAHIASLGYCSYAPTGTFTRDGCRVVEIAPRRGDPMGPDQHLRCGRARHHATERLRARWARRSERRLRSRGPPPSHRRPQGRVEDARSVGGGDLRADRVCRRGGAPRLPTTSRGRRWRRGRARPPCGRDVADLVRRTASCRGDLVDRRWPVDRPGRA
ncbi:MAG: hypothetical protein HYX32_10665 [Actinobacteria bacterium]|nr:hypothetical protein [Actinomycetota bacterium]